MNQLKINEIEKWCRQKMEVADPGHDWFHIERVVKNAHAIHQQEGGDWNILHLAALLHDVVDEKFFQPKEVLPEVKLMLKNSGCSAHLINNIESIIINISFSKEMESTGFDSLEFRIVQDADRLDAIGAIGIARTFSYGGKKNRKMYDPAINPCTYKSADDYRRSMAPTINHFYEKLLLIKDRMKTKTGKAMAEERHRFMEEFLNQFYSEWEGNA